MHDVFFKYAYLLSNGICGYSDQQWTAKHGSYVRVTLSLCDNGLHISDLTHDVDWNAKPHSFLLAA